MEQVKHFFNSDKFVFIVSTDKEQLQNSINAIYGSKFNSEIYLRRFFDLEFYLPEPNRESYIEFLIGKTKIKEVFANRRTRLQDLGHEEERFIELFIMTADVFNLSLRDIEQCITQINIIITTMGNKKSYPFILPLLITLKKENEKLYNKYINREIEYTQVLEYIKTKDNNNLLDEDRRRYYLLHYYLFSAVATEKEYSDEMTKHNKIVIEKSSTGVIPEESQELDILFKWEKNQINSDGAGSIKHMKVLIDMSFSFEN